MSRLLRVVAAIIITTLFLLSRSSEASDLQRRSPQPTPTAARPTPTPFDSPVPTLEDTSPQRFDQFWRENPSKIQAREVPYVDEYGDTIIEERIVEVRHHEPWIFRLKAQLGRAAQQTSTDLPTLTTFDSPLAVGDYQVYLPIIQKPARPPVLVLVYRYKTPAYDPAASIYQLMADLRTASIWHGYTNPNGQPAVEYGLTQEGIVIRNEMPPRQANGYYDLNAIYQQFNICARVQAGEIGEVWIWAGGDQVFSSTEFAINGPTWSFVGAGMNVPNCGKTITTMFFNFDRYISNALESYAHTFEYTIGNGLVPAGYEVCDWYPNTLLRIPGTPPSACTGSYALSDQYAFIARPAPANGYIGICGDVHLTPNQLADDGDYHWSIQTPVQSRCMDWQWGGGTVSSIGCSAWGCEACPPEGQPGYFSCNERNGRRYMIWWMQNIPGLNNISHGRTGAIRPNWWNFKFQ